MYMYNYNIYTTPPPPPQGAMESEEGGGQLAPGYVEDATEVAERAARARREEEEREWRRQSSAVQQGLPRPSEVNSSVLRGPPHKDQKNRALYEVRVHVHVHVDCTCMHTIDPEIFVVKKFPLLLPNGEN